MDAKSIDRLIGMWKLTRPAREGSLLLFEQIVKYQNDEARVGFLENALFISPVGSNDGIDWIENFQWDSRGTHGACSHFEDAAVGLLSEILTCYQPDRLKFDRIGIVGHSRGGAIALIMAQLLKKLYPTKPIEVYSFGAPKAGSREFAEYCLSNLTDHTRVAIKQDVVTRLPRIRGAHYQNVLVTLKTPYPIFKIADNHLGYGVALERLKEKEGKHRV